MTVPSAHDLVVIPATPGPLVPLVAADPTASDEVNDLLDELFGPGEDARAGWFDIALIAVGGSLAVLWSLDVAGAGVGIAGACALVLGLVLPIRAALGRLRQGRTSSSTHRA